MNDSIEWLINEIAKRYHHGKSSVEIWGPKIPDSAYEGMLIIFEVLGIITNCHIDKGFKHFDIDESVFETLQECVRLKDNAKFLNLIKTILSSGDIHIG
jgi:hypothetical protein